MVYIVTYDLQEPGQRYSELLELIKACGNWARLGQSSYLIDCQEAAVQLRDKFISVLDRNDKLYVGQVLAPAAWTGMSEDVTKWIKERL